MSTPTSPPTRPRVTVPAITAMKAAGTRIAMITAYDATFARLVDEAGVDMILVGDSVGMVVQGEPTRSPSTSRRWCTTCDRGQGPTAALVVGDLPFGSYQVSPRRPWSAVRLMKAGGRLREARGRRRDGRDDRAIAADIPVVGHIGLTPQSYHRMGGHRVQGRPAGRPAARPADRGRLRRRAGRRLRRRPRGRPARLAAEITAKLSIPTIGIGAGPTATARCSCSTTCSGSRNWTPSVRQAVRRPRRRPSPPRPRTSPTSAAAPSPDDEHSFRLTRRWT